MTANLNLNALQLAAATATAQLTLSGNTASAYVTASAHIGLVAAIRSAGTHVTELNQAARLATSARLTAADLQQFASILDSGDDERIRVTVQADPVYSQLRKLLPDNKSDSYVFLTLVIALLTFLVTLRPVDNTVTPDQVSQIVEQVVQQVEHPSGADQLAPDPAIGEGQAHP